MSSYDYSRFTFGSRSFLILREIKTYHRTPSGKSWRTHPTETEREIVSPKQYKNYITSIPFFNGWGDGACCRGYWSYTCAGYLPTTVTTVSPGREKRLVATFTFIALDELTRNAGWREREILQTAATWKQEGRMLTLYTDNAGVCASGTINLNGYQWVA